MAYAQFMAYRVADPYDLESFFTDQQDFFLPINPPYADFTLNQPGFPSAIPFDPSSFPPDFTKNLLPRLENSVPVYGIWIEEDPVTRDTVFRNEQDQVIYRIPPPPGYDPYIYIKALKPDLYSGRYPSLQLQSLLAIFDPARIRIHVTLVPEKHVEPYLFVADLLARQPPESSPMLLMGEGASDFAFVAMKPTNSIAFTIALPDMTNDIDIFTGNDLSAAWSFAARDLPHPGTNILHWIDSNDWLEVGYPVRYYAAGDAGSDADGDGFADAREVMVYQTDPTNASSRPFTVSGAVDYPGAETGPVHVVFVPAPESWSTAKSTLLPAPGGYTNHEIGNAQATWIKAFVDLDGGQRFDAWEPWGLYDIAGLLVTQDLSDIDISMADVRSVWGRIDYTGTATGDIHVLVVDDRESWDNTYESILPWNLGATSPTGAPIFLSFPADYRVVDFPAGEYYIKAFMDVDGDGLFSLADVPGHVSTNAVGIYSRTTSLDITLSEDGDGDGLPDAWEWWYLGHTMSGSGDDPDGDRLTSADELSLGTSPGVSNIVVEMSAATLVGKGKEVQRYKVGYPEFTSQAVTGSVPPKRYLDMIRQMEIQDYYQDNYCGTPQTSYQITHDKMCRYAYSPENYAQAWVEFSGTLSWHSEQEGPNCTYTSNGNGSYSTSNWPGTQCWEDYICTSPPTTTNDCCEYHPPREFPLIGGTSVTVQSTISQLYVSHDPLSTNSWISSTCTVSVITEYFLSITENLSDEYTTDEVVSDARADLAALGSIDGLAWHRMLYRYPPEEVVDMWYATNKSAEFSMDADELNVTLRDFEYHWSFPTEAGVVYRLEWKELFIPADTNTPASIIAQRAFSCIGNGQTNTTPSYYINAPASLGAVWPIILSVEFENAGQFSLTTAGYDDVTDPKLDWISVGIPGQGNNLESTFVKTMVEQQSTYLEITFCPPSIVTVDPSATAAWVDHIEISGVSAGQGNISAKVKGCSGPYCEDLGVAVYQDPRPVTRYFVVTQTGEATPTDYPADPRTEIRNRWRQGVATPYGIYGLVPVACNYDTNANGYLDYGTAEQSIISDACAQALGLGYSSHDDAPDEIWMFFVHNILKPGSNPRGWGNYYSKEAVARDLLGETYSTAVTVAHEWGHCIGLGSADHEPRDGTVMHDPYHSAGDLITKPSWDAVAR